MNEPDVGGHLLELTRRLLISIGAADWKTYRELCHETLTAFEPEALGRLVEGLEFHKHYFDLGPSSTPRNTTLAAPHVRMLSSDAAVVSYVRLVQRLDGAGAPQTVAYQETRVWQRIDERWQHVHFHRSAVP